MLSRRRLWLFRGLLAVSSAALGVGMGGTYWRAPPTPIVLHHLFSKPLQFVRPDAEIGHTNRAGARCELTSPLFRTQVAINSRGLRGPELAYERTPGRPRCVALGDSFTFGWGVEEPETFSRRLE